MKEITLRQLIENSLEDRDLRFLLKKADKLNLYLCELDIARIQDYNKMTYTSPVILFTGIIPADETKWAVISRRSDRYCLDWYKSIREVSH